MSHQVQYLSLRSSTPKRENEENSSEYPIGGGLGGGGLVVGLDYLGGLFKP